MAIWVVSIFLHLQVILQWMSVYKLHRYMFSILLGLYWGVALLDHMVMRCLAFWGTARLFSKVAAPFYQPLWGLQFLYIFVQFSSVAQSRPTLCDHMDCSTPGFPVRQQLPELAQTCVHQVSDVIQPFHLLLSPSPSAFNLFQHQGLSQWVIYLHLENHMEILCMLSYQRTNLLKFKEKLFIRNNKTTRIRLWMQKMQVQSLGWKSQGEDWIPRSVPWRRKWQPTPVEYCLGNPMDRRPW